MIALLHGYLLDGSGSNLWTRSVVRALCREGRTVHLICQEPHPERYDFVARAWCYGDDGAAEQVLERATPFPGPCILHRPLLGDILPVYVWDQYEQYEAVPMVDLPDAALEDYLHQNYTVVSRVVDEHRIRVVHANHAVLMSVVAQRLRIWKGVPYVVMPHGSALEYAVREDARLRRLAEDALADASRVIVIGAEIAGRVEATLGHAVPDLAAKLATLDLGVDTAAFRPIPRAARPGNVARVKELLAAVPRGRTAHHECTLADATAAGDAARALVQPDYDAKQPDAGLEQKLDGVAWDSAPVAGFVGRLIAAKGAHCIIGALPLALRQVPDLRLVITGHGPLREPLEALVHALSRGDRDLAARVLELAAGIDAGEPEHLGALSRFWRNLEARGAADAYWTAAAAHVRPDRVIFTGYLTHREMAWLIPCLDVAIFPSLVVEAGPLVFLEALASGVFPIGTYFGGMATKIDRVAPVLPPHDAALMKVRPDADHVVADIAHALPAAVSLAQRHRAVLRDVAERHYDWLPVGRRLGSLLDEVAAEAPAA